MGAMVLLYDGNLEREQLSRFHGLSHGLDTTAYGAVAVLEADGRQDSKAPDRDAMAVTQALANEYLREFARVVSDVLEPAPTRAHRATRRAPGAKPELGSRRRLNKINYERCERSEVNPPRRGQTNQTHSIQRGASFCLWLRPPAWLQAPGLGRSTTQAKWLPAETGAGRFMLTYHMTWVTMATPAWARSIPWVDRMGTW